MSNAIAFADRRIVARVRSIQVGDVLQRLTAAGWRFARELESRPAVMDAIDAIRRQPSIYRVIREFD